MKRITALLLVLVFVLALAACSDSKSDDKSAQQYMDKAQAYLDKGNVEEAKKVLEVGIGFTDDEELKTMYNKICAQQETETVEIAEEEETPAAVAAVNMLDGFSSSDKRTLNIFLSNFSEAYFEDYQSGSNDYEKILDFVFVHNMINNSNMIIYTENSMGISADNADKTTNKFFGKTLPKRNIGRWEYEDNKFFTMGASGESYAYFSIATKMTDNGDGTYLVEFVDYFDETNMYDAALSEWYSYTTEQADKVCKRNGGGTAVVRKKVYNGKNTYELVSYKNL